MIIQTPKTLVENIKKSVDENIMEKANAHKKNTNKSKCKANKQSDKIFIIIR